MPLNKKIINKELSFSLFLILFILNLGTAGISNFELKYFILKAAVSVTLVASIIIFIINSKINLKNYFSSSLLKRTLLIITLIIVYSSLTLLYSNNPAYGGLKILNFAICSVPAAIGAYVLINIEWNKKLFINTLIIISVIIIAALAGVLLVKPFEHSTVYVFEAGRWSHVFIGRLISFLTLILFLILLNSKRKVIISITLVITAGLFLLYLTGLRSALLGFTLAALISLIYYILTGRLNSIHYSAVFAILLLSAILIYTANSLLLPEEIKTPVRIENMLKFENMDFGGEEAIQSRIRSFELAWEMFKNSPVTGNGFGSFCGYNNSRWAATQKYPHNIILEILAELGIVGLVFFGYIFFLIIRSIFNFHHSSFNRSPFNQSPFPLLILLLFSLWLAMFSKDFSSQSFLWMFLAAAASRQ